MGWGRFSNWRPLVAVAGAAGVVAWLLYRLWQAHNRDSLSTYAAFVLPVVILIAGWAAWAWRKGKTAPPARALDDEALDHAADQLAAAVQEQWKKAAEERGLTGADPVRVTWTRPSLPLAGPASAATGSHRFDPLPGLAEIADTNLASGSVGNLHALYGGLRSGRLIIAGPPGSGKTGAAVVLVLDALRYREQAPAGQRRLVPVPVLFTVQDWNAFRQSVVDWLTTKLQATYPLFTGDSGAVAAAALLVSGRITVILDGLDEISPGRRPVALQALSQQATFRLVLLSRTREMADAAASQGVLQGAAAVELNPVDPADAASYLQRTQLEPPGPGWQELTSRIRADRDSPLSQALNSPLTLTLVRDTYHGGEIRELLEFCDSATDGMTRTLASETITGHLLDRVLPAAYTRQPGQPPLPYNLATAQHGLTRIAAQMSQDGTRDLNWWQIARWAPSTLRIATTMLAAVIALGPMAGLVGLKFGLVPGLLTGVGAVSGAAFLGGVILRRVVGGNDQPTAIGDFRISKALNKRTLRTSLIFGLFGGLVFGVVIGLVDGLAAGLAAGLAGALVIVLAMVVGDAVEADPDSGRSLQPIASWKGDRTAWLVVWLMSGATAGPMTGVMVGLSAGLAAGLEFGLAAFGAASVLALLSAQIWAVALTFIQLAIEWRTPVRLMKFLNDAHSRNVLRAVGPSYQFRHARLQDRLAAAGSPDDSNAAAPAGMRVITATAPRPENAAAVSPDSGPEH